MTTPQILLVKKSWRRVREIDPLLLAQTFYDKLFTLHPPLRNLFRSDMESQYRKFLDTFNLVIMRIDSLDSIDKEIFNLAGKHVDYGAKPEHYLAMGVTFIDTLKECLEDEWNAETEQAWKICFELLSTKMLAAKPHGKPSD